MTATYLPPVPLPVLAETIAAGIDAHFPTADRPVRQMLALCEEAGELAEAYTGWRTAVVTRAPAATLAARWDAVDAEIADVTITVYVTASVLDVPLPPGVDRLHDSPLTLTEEGHVLAVCAAASAVAAAWRRQAGMARRRGDREAVAAGLADLHRWVRRTAVVLDIDLPDACARKAAVILTRGWRATPTVEEVAR